LDVRERADLAMRMGVPRYRAGGTHYELPVLHAFCADELVSKRLNVSRFSPQHHDFQAVVMVEMSVDGGNDDLVMGVLQIGQLFREEAGVVVVDEGDGPDDEAIRGNDGGANEAIPDQVAKGLGAILVALGGNEGVEFAQKLAVNGNADATQTSHGRIPRRFAAQLRERSIRFPVCSNAADFWARMTAAGGGGPECWWQTFLIPEIADSIQSSIG
jgi:hypothetical protein